MEKLLSVVVLANNTASLERVVSCIVFQSYKNIEILLVISDTCDENGDVEILCDSLSQKYANVKTLGKCSNPLERAIHTAKGDYVSFVDWRHYVHMDMYNHLINLMEIYYADISECSIQYISNAKVNTIITNNRNLMMLDSREALKECYQFNRLTPSMHNKVYKSEVFSNLKDVLNSSGNVDVWKAIRKSDNVVSVSNQMYYIPYKKESTLVPENTIPLISSYQDQLIQDKDADSELYRLGLNSYFKVVNTRFNAIIDDKARSYKQKKHMLSILKSALLFYENEYLTFCPSRNRRIFLKILKKGNLFMFYAIYSLYRKYYNSKN